MAPTDDRRPPLRHVASGIDGIHADRKASDDASILRDCTAPLCGIPDPRVPPACAGGDAGGTAGRPGGATRPTTCLDRDRGPTASTGCARPAERPAAVHIS